MKKIKINANLVISILLYILAVAFSFLEFNDLALIILIICAVIQLFGIKKCVGNYSNMILIFSFFTILYGLSGPITTLWGNGLEDAFYPVYDYSSWFLAYSLSEIGLIIGIITNLKNSKDNIEYEKITQNKILIFGKIAVFLMFIGSSFQLINMYRIGGVSVLFMRKAIYQAKESALFLTLPAKDLIYMSLACFSIYYSYSKMNGFFQKKYLIMELVFSIPFLIQLIILGQRGNIIGMVLILILGIFFFKPLKKINPKLVKTFSIIYILMIFLYTNRAIVPLINTDRQLFIERVTDITRYVDNLNPGTNEFGAAFGNFNTLIINDDYNFKYGETYLKGPIIAIPSFLYPGTKPKQITYEFRDKYFASWGSRSAIASTGFSAILEAYWNFGYIGVFFIYFLYGVFISKLEKMFKYKSLINGIMYLCISPLFVSFSRMALGDVISSFMYVLIYATLFIIIPFNVLKLKLKRDEEKNEKNL